MKWLRVWTVQCPSECTYTDPQHVWAKLTCLDAPQGSIDAYEDWETGHGWHLHWALYLTDERTRIKLGSSIIADWEDHHIANMESAGRGTFPFDRPTVALFNNICGCAIHKSSGKDCARRANRCVKPSIGTSNIRHQLCSRHERSGRGSDKTSIYPRLSSYVRANKAFCQRVSSTCNHTNTRCGAMSPSVGVSTHKAYF